MIRQVILFIVFTVSFRGEPFTLLARYSRDTALQESVDDIQFDLADLTIEYNYPTRTVTLEGFKVRTRNDSESPKWVSIGYPTIVKTKKNEIFYFTPETVRVAVKTLDPTQKDALIEKAKIQYPNKNVLADNITPLPLIQFDCTVSFYANETKQYEVRGSVYDLRRNPFWMEFPLHQKSEKRLALEQRIRQPAALIFKCVLAATGKQEKINTLKITREQVQELDLAGKLLGPASEMYVSRNQMSKLTEEIKNRLHVEEDYEIEGEDFSDEFIQKILDASNARFEPVPIDQALSSLSKYGVSHDKRDLSPNEIKQEMSNVLQVKTEAGKQRIVAARADSSQGSSSLSVSGGVSGSSSGFWGLVDVEASVNFAMSKSNAWAKSSSSLDDQLKELNQHSQDSVQWARNGTKIIPKSLNLAKVSRATLVQQMDFSRIKRRRSDAKYRRNYEISTDDAALWEDRPVRVETAATKPPRAEIPTPPSSPVTVEQLGMVFYEFRGGAVDSGKHCISINEPADPHTWGDNYLCFNKDYGVKWSFGGEIAGMKCTKINEDWDPDSWHDNFLCVPATNPWRFVWTSTGLNVVQGKSCIAINEHSEPISHSWNNNYLCVENV